jgi:hypothetical protein
MVAIAVANGFFREAWLVPQLGEHTARQISTLLLLVLFAAYIAAVIRLWPPRSRRGALAVGAIWLLLTLAFEFGLGFFVSGLTWRQMLGEYNLAAGRLWILVPLWVAVAPYVFFRLHR